MESLISSQFSFKCLCGQCDSNLAMCPLIWSSLPHDLIIRLFTFLPQRSLLEFRCLSKAFNSPISKLHIPKLAALAPPSGFVYQWETDYNDDFTWERQFKPYVPKWFYGYVTCGGTFDVFGGKFVHSFLSSLPFKPLKDDFWGCSNGFLLVCNSTILPVQYYVCNPATRQSIAIPINPTHLRGDLFAGLAFDPLDPPPHNFKIVQVARCPEIASVDHPPELDIFSSATGNWVNHQVHLENPMEILGSKLMKRSIYFRGIFYMLSMANYLLSFNLRDADKLNKRLTVHVIKLPHTSEDDCLGLFEVSGGCLYYACEVGSELLVWTYHADTQVSPWELKYSVHLRVPHHDPSSTLMNCHFALHHCIVFAVDLCNEVVYIGTNYMVYSYDLRTRQDKEVRCMNEGIIISAESRFYMYSPCLVQVSTSEFS